MPFVLHDVPASEAANLGDALGDALGAIIRDEVTAVVVRGAIPADACERVASGADSGALPGGLQGRDNDGDPALQVGTYGEAISPSDTYPRGPDPDRYFQAVPGLSRGLAALFGPHPGFGATAERLLSDLSNGKTVRRARTRRDVFYGEATIRRIPEGSSLPMHRDADSEQAVYDDIRSRVRLDLKLSLFCMLRRPEGGGEIVLYARGGDPSERREGSPREALGTCALQPGDIFVFDAGLRDHTVTPVTGPLPRWTIGAFFAPTRDGDEIWYWA